MWCLYKDLGGGDAPTDASTASAAVLADPEQEAFSPMALKNLCFSSVAHSVTSDLHFIQQVD